MSDDEDHELKIASYVGLAIALAVAIFWLLIVRPWIV